MPGIRVNAAAELLGVSPNTLRSWERRFDYPKPRRTSGGHRQYDLTELETLRRALADTQNISSAVEVARQRGAGPSTPARLSEALDRFDEAAAEQVVEESLVVLTIERSLEEVLLPAVESTAARSDREAEHDFALRWAISWLHGVRRLTPRPTRKEGFMLIVAPTRPPGMEDLHTEALDLVLRRAGFRVISLSVQLDRERLARAARMFRPAAVVVSGRGTPRDALDRALHAAAQAGKGTPVLRYREALVGHGAGRVGALGASPSAALERIRRAEGVVSEQPVAMPEPVIPTP